MLNLEENLEIVKNYIEQKDLYIKSICYSTSAVIVLDIIRSQVPEINLLQLIPGFYLLLLFFSFLLLILSSDFFINIPTLIENQKSFGTKTIAKINIFLSSRFSIFFFFLVSLLSFTNTIPISLDSFNSYGEKALENLWSFNEVINLEIILFSILIFFSQFPLGIISIFINEKDVNQFPQVWKTFLLGIFIISGFLTPTIDGYTQLSLSIFGFSIYLSTIDYLEKRVSIKFNGTSIFGF